MKIQSGIVSTEGDELYYNVRGTGKPILFIAPGGGNGDDYLPVANILAGADSEINKKDEYSPIVALPLHIFVYWVSASD